jgi:hypothetical protein
MPNMKKPVTKKSAKGSDTKPFNVKLMTPRELAGGKEPKKPMPKKPTGKPVPASKKKLMPKTGPSGKRKNMPLTGPAAVEAIQRRTSPAGVKKAEMDAKKATNKKYPGLYKKK